MSAATLARAYKVLDDVLRRGSYISDRLTRALSADDCDRAFLTEIVYGTMERLVTVDAVLNVLLTKQPKPAVLSLLRMGVYLMRYSHMPDYAVCNECVSLAREIGKKELTGFVNAVIKKSKAVVLPNAETEEERLSVTHSYPLWLVKRLVQAYGFEKAEEIIRIRERKLAHFRVSTAHKSFLEVKKRFEEGGVTVVPSTAENCFYADYQRVISADVPSCYYVKQSLGSVKIGNLFPDGDYKRILDACAAPGGKSALLAERFPDAEVVSCEVYAHRVDRIKEYADRLELKNVHPMHHDSTETVPDWIDAFDCVLVDAPCSGLGVVSGKPEILYQRKPQDIPSLVKLQQSLLSANASYVKRGGYLVYSTCTILPEENEKQVRLFLEMHPEFYQEDSFLFLPDTDGEGFFGALLRRNA